MFVKLFTFELSLAYVHATDVFLFVRFALIANFGPRLHLARISEGFQASRTFEAVLTPFGHGSIIVPTAMRERLNVLLSLTDIALHRVAFRLASETYCMFGSTSPGEIFRILDFVAALALFSMESGSQFT